MLKTSPLLLETIVPYYQTTLKEIILPLKPEKLKTDRNLKKKTENCKKLVSFCVFVFVVPKHIAHKMVITSNSVSQKAFINFKSFNLRLIKQKT